LVVCLAGLAGCGPSTEAPEEPRDAAPDAAESAATERESVFDPLTETLDRAEGVEDTLREQSEELRRRVEEAEQ
jgi:hypothetical protein